MQKKCIKCGENKSLEEFYKDKRGTQGRYTYCKTCGKKIDKEYRIRNKQRISKKRKEYYYINKEKYPEKYKFKCYKYWAKQRNKEFELIFEEFSEIINKNCIYCGQEPLNGIDRFDSSIGYIKENCVPCCTKCNNAKHDMTIEEFKTHIAKIYSFLYKPHTAKREESKK
jgi:hypothetical protein